MKNTFVTIGIVVALLGTAGLLVLYATPRSHVPEVTPTVPQATLQPESSAPTSSSTSTPPSSSSQSFVATPGPEGGNGLFTTTTGSTSTVSPCASGSADADSPCALWLEHTGAG